MEEPVRERFIRTRYTRLAYALLALYGYALNVLGPVTPFMRAELGLSYTDPSTHAHGRSSELGFSQRFTWPSCACPSMARSSSALKWRFASACTFSRIC